ncbi:hypothetical protein PPYR_06222 [Photinus pyralis]|uniref:non-specific serine/threonine protein kinase n=1 Tax=Photinus pyralis TaxID=7054 RepID=A0A5N4ASY4_PHOPY|nr:hypothetical protein PPYR_06222 [Photinus pyralis]
MEEDLFSFGNSLNSFIEKNQPNEAEKFLSQINRTFTLTELPALTIDTYFLNIFNKTTGLLNFVKRVLHKPEYKKVKIVCFEFLNTLVRNFPVKIGGHLLDIIETCAPVVRSSCSVSEKEKSLELITLIIDKGVFPSDCEDVEREIAVLYKDTLFKCLYSRFDKSSSVTKKFPSAISNANELGNTLVNLLNRELQTTNKSMPIIHGCVAALSNFLENFGFNSQNSDAVFLKIYSCLKMLADPGGAHRKIAFRESSSLLAKHVVLFSQYVYPEAKFWHTSFLNWFNLGAEDKKSAYNVLESFLQEIANVLSAREDQELFQYFLTYFNKVIFEGTVDNYQMQLAIRGLGLFACCFRLHISAVEINHIFVTISQILENTYILTEDLSPDQIAYLPHYVQTLSFIITNLPELNNSHIVSLQLISVVLIKVFPQLSTLQHYLVVDAFIVMFHQLLQCEKNVLESFLEEIIYQGVIWTCSHQIFSDAEQLKDTNREAITYKNYLPFWNGMLGVMNLTRYEKYAIDLTKRKHLLKKLTNALVKTLFVLINKLNLKTKLKNPDNPVTDPESAFEALQTSDFVVFVNVVDFYQDILRNVSPEIFKGWISQCVNQIIYKSLQYPLVSGFYKLLTSCLQICDKLNYFNETQLEMEDVRMSYNSILQFVEDMLWKMKQYKGDLQIACLNVLLTTPIGIVKEILPRAVPAFVVLFSVGRSYLHIAGLGVDVLLRWYKSLPAIEIEPFLAEVLPCLDSYLKSRSLGGGLESNLVVKHRKTKKALSKRKVLVQTELELFKLQTKIITLIGQLNTNLCMAFINPKDNPKPVVWNKAPSLKVHLPYNNKLTLYFDKFVPRIVELSLYSSDRKMRLAACELLHAVVLILLGSSHPMDDKKKKDVDYLVRSVAEPVLKLGCDSDEVVAQLFSSLAVQMMHYYSHPRQMNMSHTEIIIETLTESITNPSDSALRDLSGKCIQEFIKWTIKQAKTRDLERNPINIKIWIRNIQSLSAHPDPFKRLGAALIFNHIYTDLREEKEMFNMFWLEILEAFVTNLSLTQIRNADDNNCVEQVLIALNHVQRGFVEKSALFNANSNTRRKPPVMDGILLKDVAMWLLKETGNININCRKKCMDMFCKIAPLSTGCHNSLNRFKELYITGTEWINSTYETELMKYPTINHLGSSNTTDGIFKWCHGLLCCLDGYIFLLANNLMPKDAAPLFTSVDFFLDHVLEKNIGEVVRLNCSNSIYTAEERKYFNHCKSLIVTKLMDLIVTIFKSRAEPFAIGVNFLPEHSLWNLVCLRIFDPVVLGFDQMENSEDVSIFLNNLSDHAPENVISCLQTGFQSHVNKFNITNKLGSGIVPFKERQLIKGLMTIKGTRMKDKLNVDSYSSGILQNIHDELIVHRDGKIYAKDLHKSATEYCHLKLQFALDNKDEFVKMCQLLCVETMIITDQQKEIKYGYYFFEKFKDSLLKYLVNNYAVFLSEMSQTNINESLFTYVFEILRYIRHNRKQFSRDVLQDVVESSLQLWNGLVTYFNGSCKQILLGIEFLAKLGDISQVPLSDLIKNASSISLWVIGLFSYTNDGWTEEDSLNFVSEVINILPIVIGHHDLHFTELGNALENINDVYYNEEGGTKNKLLLFTTFKKLVDSMRSSKSKLLLKYVATIYATTPYINQEIKVDTGLKLFFRHNSSDEQLYSINSVYAMSSDSSTFTYFQRYLLAKDILSVLLQTCHYDVFESFFVTNIGFFITSFDTDNVAMKTILCILMEVLFLRIAIDNFQNNSCNISKAAFPEVPPSEKKMLKTITGLIIQIGKETNVDDASKHFFRLYQCHAYNALISIISNTQTDLTFYNLLFNRETLWSKIVDTDRLYNFAIDFDTIPSLRKSVVNIRRSMADEKRKTNPDFSSVKYMPSQHLFNSTLSEDITKFDFTHSVLRSQSDEQSTKAESGAFCEREVVLEGVEINLHECMASVCGLFQHMADIGLLPLDTEDVAMPPWLKAVRNVLMSDVHKNVKIFLIKVIHNSQDTFKYFAKYLYGPIIQAITDCVFGNSINFFINDMVVMLTSWASITLPTEDVERTSELLSFLMRNCDTDVRSVFKYNLELIKLIIETWKTCISIPHDVIYEKLQLPENSQKLDIGVHLAATVLANNIAPWRTGAFKDFLMALCKVLRNDHRAVYQPCSEVLGMSLNFVSQDHNLSASFERFKEYLHKCIAKLSSNDDKFAYCIQGIALHYAPIADKYLCKLTSKLNHVHGNFKNIYLNIFLSRIDVMHNINELSSLDFQSLLLDENLETQLLTLQIIEKSVNYLRANLLLDILRHVSKFVTHTFTLCRTIMFDIFITTYSTHKLELNSFSQDLTELSKDVLLQGLVDKELVVQEKLLQFWSDRGHFPVEIDKMFLHLLNTMYKPSVEEHYVCYSSYLLLTSIITSEEYSEKLFEHPLYDCDFHEYVLNSNWRRQHASMAPLFASSLHSQDVTMHTMDYNVLRSTVSTLEFQPTLAPARASSSLLFTLTDEATDAPVFKDPNVVLPKRDHVRSRRFLKDKSKVSRHFAYLEVKKSVTQEELRQERIKRSEKNVQLCRKYRIGEYPDIEIPLSSVINPLQILVFCDPSLARHFYTSLFTSLITKIKKDQAESDEFSQSMNTGINNILNTSTQFATNTIGTFLDIALSFTDTMRFDPNIITTVSEESGLLSLGSLLLEEYLSSSLEEAPASKKRRGVESPQTNHWVKLAELYKEMNEWDVVSSIFLEKMNCNETVLHAIEAESIGHWRAAQEAYATVIKEDTSEYRRDFYYESYFKAFAALGEWDRLSEAITDNVCGTESDNTWTYLWDNGWNQQKLLPWFITSELRNTLSGNGQIFSSVNTYLKDPEKSLYLKSNFGEELAMLCLLQNDVDTAKYYLNDTITSWLENWSTINPLFVNLRANTISGLKGPIDIYLFTQAITSINMRNFQFIIDDLLKSWDNLARDPLDSLLLSETLTVYRNQFVSVIEEKLLALADEDDIRGDLMKLKKFKCNIHVNLIEHALMQDNYYIARKYVKLIQTANLRKLVEETQWSLAVSKVLLYRSKTIENKAERFTVLLTSWTKLGPVTGDLSPEDSALCCVVKRTQHVYDITQLIYALSQTDNALFNGQQDALRALMGVTAVVNPETVWQFGVDTLQKTLVDCENEIKKMMETDDLKVYSHMANSYLKLAYCTQNKEDGVETFIISTLRAMKLGSTEGKQLFPCLLSKDLAQFKSTFQAESSKIPTWMFLNWIPQLLANLDTAAIFAISDIIVEIAQMYPQAIMYAYRLSKGKYKLQSNTIGIYGKKIIETLDGLLLSNTQVDTLLYAFASVTSPTNVLEYYMKRICASNSEEQFKENYQKLMDELYPPNINYKSPKSLKGPIFKKIAEYEHKLKEIMKGKFDLKRNCEKLSGMVQVLKGIKYTSVILKDYCPWLEHFQSTELRENLEIPGQYLGNKRPLPQYHTKIMGFAPSVLVLNSLRRPIRITILGNDAKEYNYLVKFGEDLRQDQRIEQVFNLMNTILSHNIACNQRQMRIETYQVIPLTSALGIIEWLDDTKELKEFIVEALANQAEQVAYNSALSSYHKWIEKATPKSNKNMAPPDYYGRACMNYARGKTITNYLELVSRVPADILRRAFTIISVDSANFFALRHQFTVSYAVLCTAQWLLGIGDRHLSNTMISLQTGAAIGVDFGCAFGFGTQILPIPELVPLRLTPHIVNLFQPFNEHGLLQETMIHCMRAFRKSSDILLSTMNVFIMEPTIDWLDAARRSEETSGHKLKQSLYSKQKMEHARSKLEGGVNPVSVTIEELRSGHSHNPSYLEEYIKVVEGVPSENFRAGKSGKLSEEDQVKCLIDQATDQNLLGRMYEGWHAWV